MNGSPRVNHVTPSAVVLECEECGLIVLRPRVFVYKICMRDLVCSRHVIQPGRCVETGRKGEKRGE